MSGLRIGHRLRRHLREVTSLLLPDQCQLCEALIAPRWGGGLCRHCLHSIVRIEQGCLRCGAPVPEVSGPQVSCLQCRDGRWPARRVMAIGVYQGTLRAAVIKLKQPGSEALAYSLGQLMGKWLKANAPSLDYDLIVSTPKHWWKQWQRPHNSSELLADAISYHLGKPVDHRLLRRVRLTAKQGTLQRHARAENVRRAFEIPRKHRVAGRSVLLVDDIVTSGSTMAEMTEAMYQAGAQVVDVACLARGIGR